MTGSKIREASRGHFCLLGVKPGCCKARWGVRSGWSWTKGFAKLTVKRFPSSVQSRLGGCVMEGERLDSYNHWREGDCFLCQVRAG